jgi:RNA polymerase sigma-70 factor (ECF subfamily)
MEELSDFEAIKRIKKGEINYFSFIVKKYTPRILSYISYKINNLDDREDIVQNTLIHFYKAIDRFDEKKSIMPYLTQILLNELKMFYRSKKKNFSLDEAILIEEGETLYELAAIADIEKLLSTLPDNQKKVLQLIQEGYTYKEISKKIGSPVNTIKTWVRRARLIIHNYRNEKS